MIDLYCLSLDFRNSDTETRAKAWTSRPELFSLRKDKRILEAIAIHTCNRSELYFILPKEREIPSSLLYMGCNIYSGKDAAGHLLRVLLGLESMAYGEMHITGQVKTCYDENTEFCGRLLHRLFQGALKMSKILRTCYHPGMEPSIPYLMAEILKEHPSFPDMRAMVVGTGKIGKDTAAILSSMCVSTYATNRTDEKGTAAADELGIPYIPWNDWKVESETFQAIFFCSGSGTPLLKTSEARGGTWIFDMGSPAQVEDDGGKEIRLTCIDNLTDRADALLKNYRVKMDRLEREADDSSALLWSELCTTSGDAYKRLVLARAGKIVLERAEMTSKKTGASDEVLRQMGWSIVKAVLSPLLEEKDVHVRRVWKMLAGDIEEHSDGA
jgi:glutamyl-tRNA reductase